MSISDPGRVLAVVGCPTDYVDHLNEDISWDVTISVKWRCDTVHDAVWPSSGTFCDVFACSRPGLSAGSPASSHSPKSCKGSQVDWWLWIGHRCECECEWLYLFYMSSADMMNCWLVPHVPDDAGIDSSKITASLKSLIMILLQCIVAYLHISNEALILIIPVHEGCRCFLGLKFKAFFISPITHKEGIVEGWYLKCSLTSANVLYG